MYLVIPISQYALTLLFIYDDSHPSKILTSCISFSLGIWVHFVYITCDGCISLLAVEINGQYKIFATRRKLSCSQNK